MAAASKNQSNGVFPVNTSQLSGNSQRPTSTKALSAKLKVLIRRLPPGLLENEFTSILGDDWKLGRGRVDWFRYKSGKDSTDPSKPSRPARAYLHLTNEIYLIPLSEFIGQVIFEDAANTAMSACLVGPPTVEFAPYGRTPGGRRRADARAGTIDQDPEFMGFLEELANPVSVKEFNAEASGVDATPGKSVKVTTTPLVQYLKDKKANKNKEAAVKALKKQEAQQSKNKGASTSSEDVKKKGKDGKSSEKSLEKAAKEAVRILNREASKASPNAPTNPKTEASVGDINQEEKSAQNKSAERPRNNGMTAHIRMLQRDLGLSPAQAHRQFRRENADAQKGEKNTTNNKSAGLKVDSSQPGSSSVVPTAPKVVHSLPTPSRSSRKRGVPNKVESTVQSTTDVTSSTPVVLLKKSSSPQSKLPQPNASPNKATDPSSARKPTSVAMPSTSATQAFIKHANPSQGVTELLLKEALEKFGPVSFVEIDKRKGFAYVDFVDSEGLRKAMAANPITVAQGTVHVAQRKGVASTQEKKSTPPNPSSPSNRGGRGSSRGGGVGGRRGGRGGRGGVDSGRAPPIPGGQSTT